MLDFDAELTSKSLNETYNGRLFIHGESSHNHRLDAQELRKQHTKVQHKINGIQSDTTNAPRWDSAIT
jgi:hypothetical protein